jgi:hypothetical protein
LCKFEHNPCGKPHECYDGFEYVGENIWLGGFKGFTPKSAIDAWYNESAYYEFDSLSCSQVCGRYTQVNILVYWLLFMYVHFNCRTKFLTFSFGFLENSSLFGRYLCWVENFI